MLKARISFHSNASHVCSLDEEYIQEYLCGAVGEKLADNGIPLFVEAAAWCMLASVGETYECDDFTIEIVEK